MIEIVIYALFCIVSMYVLSVAFSSDCEYLIPGFSIWREEVVGAYLVLGILVALVPIVNTIMVAVCIIGWLTTSARASKFFTGKPFSKHKDIM
jgi:Na+-transporting NADH:ubiquinone oxidoreductase subunit NqrB